MGFLSSDNIKVFPSGGRNSTYDPLARLTTEQNLVSIINRLVDKKSFIVSSHANGVDISSEPNPYLINIGGYLFNILTGPKGIFDSFSEENGGGINPSNGKYIIAKINIQQYGNYQQLSPIDALANTPIEYNGDKTSSTLTQIGATAIYSHSDGFYVKKEGGKYYYCDNEGNYIYWHDTILDSEEIFHGISFEQSSSASVSNTTLTLFECLDNSKWVEYEDSKIKFETNGICRSVKIDDGIL